MAGAHHRFDGGVARGQVELGEHAAIEVRANDALTLENGPDASEILVLRARKAKLLGFETFAHWQLSNTMAAEPRNAMDLMTRVWKAARTAFLGDVAEAQKEADKDGVTIAPWDYRYYAEKVRKAKYSLDLEQLTPFLQLERLRDAMFWQAGALYGLTFERVAQVQGFHPEVEVYEVQIGRAHV